MVYLIGDKNGGYDLTSSIRVDYTKNLPAHQRIDASEVSRFVPKTHHSSQIRKDWTVKLSTFLNQIAETRDLQVNGSIDKFPPTNISDPNGQRILELLNNFGFLDILRTKNASPFLSQMRDKSTTCI